VQMTILGEQNQYVMKSREVAGKLMLIVLVLLPNPVGLDVAARPEYADLAQTSAVKTASLLATKRGRTRSPTPGVVNMTSC